MSKQTIANHGDPMEWSEDCEKYFLEILATRVRRDPNGAPIFKMTDWIEIDEEIFLKFALRYSPEKLKGKYNRLRSMHTKFSELISHTSVVWDSNTGRVFANDSVCDDYFKKDRIFKSFKRKGCKLYPLLTIVFSGSTASGAFHNASTTAPQTSEEEHRLGEEYLATGEKVRESGSGSKKYKLDDVDMEPGMRRVKKNLEKTNLITLWMCSHNQFLLERKET